MGFTEILTLVFIILKLIGVIKWNWFLVLIPEIMAFAFYLFVLALIIKQDIDIEKRFDEANKIKQKYKN